MKLIGVVGTGQMGIGIAQVAAQSGFVTRIYDMDFTRTEKARGKIGSTLETLVQKGKIERAIADRALANISTVKGLNDLAEADIVIEAINEVEASKKSLFKELDQICRSQTIFASNTSSISITRLAGATNRADRFIGMHFMNPVPVMKLVEGIRALQTSEETVGVVRKLAENMGKTFVEVRDIPGFAVNRILMPMINEAVYAVYEGIAKPEDIDLAMKLGTNQPMGPLTLADFIGLDTCLAIMEVLFEGLGDSKYRACPLLRQYVDAGWLGKKTGRGFYKYE